MLTTTHSAQNESLVGNMEFEEQKAIDTVIFVTAAAFALLCVGHIVMLWRLRRDFFIVLR